MKKEVRDNVMGVLGGIFYAACVQGVSIKKLAEDTGIAEDRILSWFGPEGLDAKRGPDVLELSKVYTRLGMSLQLVRDSES